MENESSTCRHLALCWLAAYRARYNRGSGCHGPEEFVEIMPLGARELVRRHLRRGLVQSFNLRDREGYLNGYEESLERRVVDTPARGQRIRYLADGRSCSHSIDDETHERAIGTCVSACSFTQGCQ